MFSLSGLLVVVLSISGTTADNCQLMQCSSFENNFAFCSLPTADAITRLNVVDKYSKACCTYGVSYGPGRGHIWVNNGCRAMFHVCYERAPLRCFLVECRSMDYKFASCPVPQATVITQLTLTRQFSRASCSYGTSYGPGLGSVWVDHGCFARFNACFEITVINSAIKSTTLHCLGEELYK